ncbi:FecR domain-containing protein [Novispirillum sp. DQ9]|uniref:FecR family protein n=1 Tax=Novispirillum sp. DQ9 TaxID=3398612 RepID=UPI003C7A7E02
MAPADSTDWMFAALALTTAVTSTASASASASTEGPQAGVVTGALSSTRAISGAPTNTTAVVLGDAVRAGEEFRTGPDGIIHILFLDQSSITLGPDSSLVLDTFTHDEATRSGKIVMTLHEGSVRIVGGANSKGNATEIRTPDSTVGILGGISIVETRGQQTNATFLFGQQMRVSNGTGTQTVTRPGFSVSSNPNQISTPQRTPTQQLSSLTGRFEAGGSPNTGGGSPQPPNTQPSPSPSAPLISVSDRPAGTGSPPTSLAPDRLSTSNSSLVGAGMSRNRPDTVTATNTPAPVNNVRTPPPVVTS